MAQVQFALSPTGKLEAAAQAKFAFTTSVAATLITTVGSVRVTSGTFPVFTFPANDNLRFQYGRSFPNLTLRAAITSGGTTAAICTWDFNAAGLADSEVIALHWRYTAAANPTHDYFASIVKVSDGTTLASGSTRFGDVTLPGTSSIITIWNNAVAGDVKGAAVFSAAPAAGVHVNPSADPNLVALYYMADNGSGLVADETGGTALTVTNGTFDTTADDWDASAGPTVAKSVFPFFLR
jgi:hypothetical protein